MNIHVIETVCQIAQQQQTACLITNSGPGTVYLGTASYVTPTGASLTLLPRQSVNWQGGALWGICEPGAYAELMILPGGNTTVSPVTSVEIDQPVSIDGPVEVNGTVGIDGTVTVEGNVGIAGDVNVTGQVSIDGGVDINGTVPITGEVSIDGPVNVDGDLNITAMDVTVSTQIAGDISIAGTPPINSTVSLFTGTPTLGGNQAWEQTYDVTHNQLVIRIQDQGPASLPPVDTMQSLFVTYLDTKFEYAYKVPIGDGYSVIRLPNMGKRVRITYQNEAGPFVTPTIAIFGTYLQEPLSVQWEATTPPPTGTLGAYTSPRCVIVTASGQTTTARRIRIPSRNGRASIGINGLGSNGNTFQLGIPNGFGSVYYFYSNTAVPSAGINFDMITPDMPIHLRYALTSGTTGFTLTMNYQ